MARDEILDPEWNSLDAVVDGLETLAGVVGDTTQAALDAANLRPRDLAEFVG